MTNANITFVVVKPCKLPPFLKPGSRIALVATAKSVTPEEVKPAIDILNTAGFEVVPGKNLYAVHNIFAGNDEQRAADLQWALDDESTDAIVFARGGYGTLRVVDTLDFTRFLKNPKWVVGYSDITVLHNAINTRGICTLHGTMAFSFTKHVPSTEKLIEFLQGKFSAVEWETNAPDIKTEGTLCGGNLSLLYALTGSKDLFAPDNKLVFIEDLDEYYYHIDRMVLSLTRSGYFNNTRAVIGGGFDDMKDNPVPFGQNEEEILYQHLNKSVPIIPGFPAGHGLMNMPLVMGLSYQLNVKNKKGNVAPLL